MTLHDCGSRGLFSVLYLPKHRRENNDEAQKRKAIGEIFDTEWDSTPMTLQDLKFILDL